MLVSSAASAVRLSLGKMVAASLAFAGGVFLLMAGGSIYSIRQTIAAQDAVTQSEEVKTQLNGIQALMKDLESAAQGYVITGQEDYLSSYQETSAQINSRLITLGQLVQDNVGQAAQWNKLKPLMEHKLEIDNSIIQAGQVGGFEAAAAIFESGEPKQASDSIQECIAAMTQDAEFQLEQRRAQSAAEDSRSIAAAIGTSVIGLAGLGLGGLMLMRQFRARRQAEAALAHSRMELQDIVDNAPMTISLKDLNGRYLLVNQPVKELLGFEAAATVGKTIDELFPAEQARVIHENDVATAANRQPVGFDHEITRADGSRRIFHTIKFALRDSSGRPYAICSLGADVTERKRMEGELRQALTAAEAASRTKSQFLANMSHELRTPLNSIIGFSEILSDRLFGSLNEKQQQYLKNILTSGRHLLLLINDLLDLAKIEAGRMQLELERTNLASVVQDGATLVRGSAERKGVLVEVSSIAPEWSATLDPARTKQIIYNLLSNAVKFTPAGGRVVLTVERLTEPARPRRGSTRGLPPGETLPGEWLQLSVVDSGIGIGEEDLERIFLEFEQVDGSYSREVQGTGLGLALTRKLVELHGGCVWAESPGQVNRGSAFHVLLPIAGVPTENIPSAAPRPPLAEPAAPAIKTNGHDTPARHRPLVLVIEDDQHARHLLTEYLSAGGYEVAHATTGQDGLRLAGSLRPAAITLDIILPDGNGMDVLARLKATRATSQIPVVIISVTDDRQLGLSLGAAEFFVKPVSADVLLAALTRAGATMQHEIQRVLVVDDEPAARESISAMLEPRGYQVLCAASGEEALRIMTERPPDVAIVDLTMPGMSGFELVNHLRQNPATQELPICIYTAKDLSAEEMRWLHERAAAITPKPFRAQLLSELKRVCANTA
jgi:PAS domain S-box-containing protein